MKYTHIFFLWTGVIGMICLLPYHQWWYIWRCMSNYTAPRPFWFEKHKKSTLEKRKSRRIRNSIKEKFILVRFSFNWIQSRQIVYPHDIISDPSILNMLLQNADENKSILKKLNKKRNKADLKSILSMYNFFL